MRLRFAFLRLGAPHGAAQQCAVLANRFESSGHVFLAKIISARVTEVRNREVLDLTFEVLESYKGSPTRVELTADSGNDVERSNYRGILVGAHYVFFIHDVGTTHLGFCSRHELVLYEQMRVSSIVEELRQLAVDAT